MRDLRENRRRRGIQLFDHPLLDWASRVHPVLPAAFWGPLAISAMAGGMSLGVRGISCVTLFIAGYVSWWFTEYSLHRWMFHFKPRPLWLRRLWYYVHEHHHRYQEWDRLLAPPLLALPFILPVLGVAYATLGLTLGVGAMWVFLSGLIIGYLVYDYTHLWIHFARPTSRWGRYVRRCHLEHHFTQPDRWFCISLPWIDYIFGTSGRRPGTDSLSGSQRKRSPPEDEDTLTIPKKVREYEAAQRSGTQINSPGS